MEMEMEVVDLNATDAAMERLLSAAAALEEAAARLAAVELRAQAGLEEKLHEAEATIAALKAGGRKTAGVGLGTMMAKESVGGDAAGVDAALVCLSMEQRIAVKAGLMRAGLLG